MSLINKGYRTLRYNDFGGGINLRDSNDAINDKQWQVGNNMTSEGNKLVTMPGYSSYFTPAAGATGGQGIALYSGKILTIHNRNLYIYNTVTGAVHTHNNAVGNKNDTYQILTSKSFTGLMSIVIININPSVNEDIVAFEYNATNGVITPQSFIGLTNKNFKCGLFYQGSLLLGGNPDSPSVLYYSKIGNTSPASEQTNYLKFDAYPAGAQQIGDGEPIVSIITNHNELFVFKTNSVWRVNGNKDTGTSYGYILRQETATGAINNMCALPVEQDIIYFDGINIRRLSYERNINALNDDSISKEVLPLVDALPKEQAQNACMYFAYPHVKLCLRDKFSVKNNMAIVYNIVDKGYSTQSGIDVVQGIGGFINNRRTAYFVSSQTSTIFQDNYGVTYNGGNIQFNHLSKRYIMTDGVDYKRISQVEFYGEITPGLRAYIDVYINGLIVDTREIFFEEIILPTTGSSLLGNTLLGGASDTTLTTKRAFVVRFEYFHDGRDFMFSLRGNGQGEVELHGMNIMYKNIKAYDLHY